MNGLTEMSEGGIWRSVFNHYFTSHAFGFGWCVHITSIAYPSYSIRIPLYVFAKGKWEKSMCWQNIIPPQFSHSLPSLLTSTPRITAIHNYREKYWSVMYINVRCIGIGILRFCWIILYDLIFHPHQQQFIHCRKPKTEPRKHQTQNHEEKKCPERGFLSFKQYRLCISLPDTQNKSICLYSDLT